jgi:hypothetical protein
VTYAESLQLILALMFGLFLSLPSKRTRAGLLLLIAIAATGGVLLLTVTRATWVAALISAG